MKIDAEDVYVFGDTHAEFSALNKKLSRLNYPDVIIQVGDFGWWPHYHNAVGLLPNNRIFDQYGLRNKNTKIFWCDGNHDNHDDLRELVKRHGRIPIEIMSNVYYCPRGSVVTISNLNFLFFGGARSVDKHMRVPGDSWWAGENISYDDMDSLDKGLNIHAIVSHDCPSVIKKNLKAHYKNEVDSNNIALDEILDIYRPKRWFFGHYHLFQSGVNRGCNWMCLSNIENSMKSFHKIRF